MLQVFFSAGALPPVTSIFFIVSVALLDGNPYFNDRVFPVPVKSFIVFFEMDEVCRQGLVLYIGQEISVKFFIGIIDSVHRAGMFCHQVLVGLDFFQNKAIRYNCSFGNGAKVNRPAVLSFHKGEFEPGAALGQVCFFQVGIEGTPELCADLYIFCTVSGKLDFLSND